MSLDLTMPLSPDVAVRWSGTRSTVRIGAYTLLAPREYVDSSYECAAWWRKYTIPAATFALWAERFQIDPRITVAPWEYEGRAWNAETHKYVPTVVNRLNLNFNGLAL